MDLSSGGVGWDLSFLTKGEMVSKTGRWNWGGGGGGVELAWAVPGPFPRSITDLMHVLSD